MDNKLNEIRRKISFLRSEMLRYEDTIRKQVNRDEDVSQSSMQLMAMRVVMLGLIAEPVTLGDKAEHHHTHGHQLHGGLGNVLVPVDLFADGVLIAQHFRAQEADFPTDFVQFVVHGSPHGG